MSKSTTLLIVALCLLIVGSLFFSVTPIGKKLWNQWFYVVQKADDVSAYDTRKTVEDTCRAMIASYTADKLTYEQYRESANEEKLGWAEQAKMRANKTAASYNEFILKNTFVWNGNVPEDIQATLPFLE